MAFVLAISSAFFFFFYFLIFESVSCYIAWAELKLEILLSQPPRLLGLQA